VSTSKLIIEKSSELFTVTYDNNKKIVSSFFKEHFQAAQALCKEYQNFTACQLLGNLCVLLDYTRDLVNSKTQSDACKVYTDISSDSVKVKGNPDWPINMPWLYYKDSDQDAVDTLDRRDIKTRFTANGGLIFTLSIFNLNGSFVGLENGTSSLQLCQDKQTKMDTASKFATTFVSSCSVPVSKLLSMPMYFYDMFVLLDSKDLYAVPVLVQNYKFKKDFVNTKSDRTNFQLTRRFFLVENLVGKTSANGKVTMIRYAKEIHIIIRLRSSNGEIYPPYLNIKYDSVDVSNQAEVAKSSKSVSFRVSYEMNDSKIKDDTLVSNLFWFRVVHVDVLLSFRVAGLSVYIHVSI
jgi:meckelin